MLHGYSTQPERTALHTVHELAEAQVALCSPPATWASIAATRFRTGKVDVTVPTLEVPAYGINYGQYMKLERTLNGRTIGTRAGAGQLSLLTSDAQSRWVFDEPADVALVFLSGEVFHRAIDEASGRHRGAVEIAPKFAIRDLALERVAHLLLKEISEPGPATRLVTDELAEELAGHLLLSHSNLPSRQKRAHAMAPGKLHRVRDYILSSLHREIALVELADVAGMSLFHFAKAFKQATGQAPHQYLTAQRILQARALLHRNTLSVSVIAGLVGLSHSHFTAVFRRQMGMTPRQFRDVLTS
jgi:AraC family transcriptional regulator